MPLCMSILADLYGPEERAAATGLLATVTGIGTGTGQNLGGILGPLAVRDFALFKKIHLILFVPSLPRLP